MIHLARKEMLVQPETARGCGGAAGTESRVPDRLLAVSYMAVSIVLTLCLPVDVVLFGQGATGMVSVYFYEFLAWCLFGLVLANELSMGRADILRRGWNRMPSLFLYLAWCLFAVIMVYGLRASADTIGKLKNLLPGALVFIMMQSCVRGERQLFNVIFLYLCTSTAIALLGLLQYQTGAFYLFPSLGNNAWKADFDGNYLTTVALGLYSTPNNFAAALVPCVILSTTFAAWKLRRQRYGHAALLSAICIVLLAALVVSFSKGGLLWCGVGLLIAVGPWERSRYRVALLLTPLTILAVTLYGTLPQQSAAAVDTSTTVARIGLWHTALFVMDGDGFTWLFGDASEGIRYWSPALAGWLYPDAHNTWINQAVMFGLPAVVLYAGMWMHVLRRLGATAAHGTTSHFLRAVVRGLLGVLFAMAGLLFFEPRADGVFQFAQITFLFSLALIAAEGCRIPNASELRKHRRTGVER